MDYEPSCLFPMDLLSPSLTLSPDKDNNTKWQTMNPLLSFHITLFPFLLFLKKYPTSSANQACKIDAIQIQFYIYNHCQLLYITIDNLDRNNLSDQPSSSYNYYSPLHAPPCQDPWTDLERSIQRIFNHDEGRDRITLIISNEDDRIEGILEKELEPRGMHAAVVVSDKERSVRCTPVGGRECPVRDPHPFPPPRPSVSTPPVIPLATTLGSVSPGLHRGVNALAWPRLRIDLHSLHCWQPPLRGTLSLSPLSLPPPRRLVTLVTISQLCLGEGKRKGEIGGGLRW